MLDLIDSIYPSSADRRAKPRFQPTYQTTCCLMPTPQRHGLVWDVSVYGVGLLLADRPMPGEVIPIQLQTERDAAPIATSIQVVYVRELSTGDYFVGAKFTRSLTPAEIDTLVTSASEQAPTKRGPTNMKTSKSRKQPVGC